MKHPPFVVTFCAIALLFFSIYAFSLYKAVTTQPSAEQIKKEAFASAQKQEQKEASDRAARNTAKAFAQAIVDSIDATNAPQPARAVATFAFFKDADTGAPYIYVVYRDAAGKTKSVRIEQDQSAEVSGVDLNVVVTAK